MWKKKLYGQNDLKKLTFKVFLFNDASEYVDLNYTTVKSNVYFQEPKYFKQKKQNNFHTCIVSSLSSKHDLILAENVDQIDL